MLLAAYFADHPCRTPWPADAAEPPAAAGSPVPILHIIALPVRTISLLAAKQAAPLRERLSALLSALVASRPFQRAPERHVLLHTSTAKMTYVFGAKCAQTLERARGIMTLSFEGPGGDKRLGAHVATERTIVVPYFIEPPALIDLGLAALAAGSVPPTFAAEFAREREYAGVGARVYMRASSGAAYGQGLRNLRSTLGSLFERERGADVRLRPRLDQQNHGTQQAAFYATMAAMRNSTFCLIPRGMTATSRRLYESLACGCVPVLISDDFLLPFQATHGQLWQAAVLRQPEAELAQLPARLRAITPEQVRAMRQAGASLLPALTYIAHAPGNGAAPASSVAAADGQATGASASRLILAQLQALALGATPVPAAAVSSSLAQLAPPAAPSVVPADLAEAVSRAGVLVLTVCSASDSAAYTVGQKRATGAQECIRWLRSLRRAGYAGPVAILASTRSSALRSHLASAAGASGGSGAGGGGSDSASSGGTWLIDQLEQRLPRTPPLAGISRPPALSGNQLRLAWYMHTMAALEQAAPSARVLAVDARDVYFQAEPIAALESAAGALGQGARCGLVFIADCRSCAALADDYFRRQGVRCLSPSALDAIGSTNPPLNGGVVLGTPPLLLKLYSTAAKLAVAQDDECRAMGRDQHLLTAAGFELQREARQQQALAPVCLLRNDASLQAAVANLGVNNDVRGMFSLDQKSGVIESVPLRQPIALLHQFDRRKEMKAFVLKHYEASI